MREGLRQQKYKSIFIKSFSSVNLISSSIEVSQLMSLERNNVIFSMSVAAMRL